MKRILKTNKKENVPICRKRKEHGGPTRRIIKETRNGVVTLIGPRNNFRGRPVCPQSKMKHVRQVVAPILRMNHFGGYSDHHVKSLSVDHLRTEVQERAYFNWLAEEDVINVDKSRQALTEWNFHGKTIKKKRLAKRML